MVHSTADILEVPASRETLTLLTVDRAISELRRGRFVVIRGNNASAALILAAEGVTPDNLEDLAKSAGAPARLTISSRRARVLNIARPKGHIITLSTTPVLNAEIISQIADPAELFNVDAFSFECHETATYDSESAAVTLAKLARLLPAALTAPIQGTDTDDLAAWALRHNLFLIDSCDVFQYEKTASTSRLFMIYHLTNLE